MPRIAALAVAAAFAVMAYFFLRGEPRVLEAAETPPAIENEQPQEAVIDASDVTLFRSEVQTPEPELEAPTEEPQGLLLVGVLPDGSEVTPDRVDGYRGAKPRLWLPGPEGIRVDPEDHSSLFFNAVWQDSDGQLWSGEGWFDVAEMERVEVPLQRAALQVAGTVRQGGKVVADLDVHLSDRTARFATKTDESGRFHFVLPRPAESHLMVGYVHSPGVRMELDLRDGKDRDLEIELPTGALNVAVFAPEGVDLPREFAVGLRPVDPLLAMDRQRTRYSPLGDDQVARFASVPAGDYVLTVGAEVFRPNLLTSLEVSPWQSEVRIGLEPQELVVQLPQKATARVFVRDPGRMDDQGLHCLIFYQRLDAPISGPRTSTWSSSPIASHNERRILSPGKYRFLVNGHGKGFHQFEAQIEAGEDYDFEVELEPAAFSTNIGLTDKTWAETRSVQIMSSEGAYVGKFNCNTGIRTGMRFTHEDGSESEPSVYDSTIPKMQEIAFPSAGEYSFYGVPKSSGHARFLGTHYLNGTRSELTLEAQD